MAKVKCSRCDRRYSPIRLKCPYCGAHRSRNTVRREREDISPAKYIIGALVLLALIAAVAVLIIMSMKNKAPDEAQDAAPQTEFSQDEGVNSVTGEGGSGTANDVTDEKVEITAVKILADGAEEEEVSLSEGGTCELTYKTEPVESEELAIWTSDDEAIAVVMQNGQVTAVGKGTTAVNVKIGDKTDSIIIRVD
ncbi:MAG: Ig-like domain-containing protein [Oscillospiraceae bacterium]|nr:Ig-like domain-containing protein [Oscillospiraceae bacterium]